MQTKANEVRDLKHKEFTPKEVKAYIKTVAESPAGGMEKAAALSQQLIATRFQLYAIEIQNQMGPGMGSAEIKSLSQGLETDIKAYLEFQKTFFGEKLHTVTDGFWGEWMPMVKSSSQNMLACGARARI